jgi:hypothetical protein
MNRILLLLAVFLQLFVFCHKDQSVIDPEINRVSAEMLKLSPENVVIAGEKLTLETYLWRDFMPGIGKDGSPMMGSIKFIGQSGDILLNTLSISKVYVVNAQKVCTFDSFETRIIEHNVFEVVVREGPEWDTYIEVDVICEFKNQGQLYRLITKSQKIKATY